jgi:hypothetical protein
MSAIAQRHFIMKYTAQEGHGLFIERRFLAGRRVVMEIHGPEVTFTHKRFAR